MRTLLCGLALCVACGGASYGSGATAPYDDAGMPADGGSPADAGLSGGMTDGGSMAEVISISLSQTDVRIPVGAMTAFAVTADYSDGSRGDVTQQAQASSTNTAVATVAHGQGAQIQITAVAQGSARIIVTLGSLQQTCAVTVTPH